MKEHPSFPRRSPVRNRLLRSSLLIVSCAAFGCSSSGSDAGSGGTGAVTGSAGAGTSSAGQAAVGSAGAGGAVGKGGGSSVAGAQNAGGTSSGAGGATGSAGSPATSGAGTGGAATGGASSGGAGASGSSAGGATAGPDCSTPMPTGGDVHMGSSINGTADGLGYGIWTNGSGGSITTFANAHAFSAAWNNSQDFLAHVGLDFNASKAYTAYGAIIAQYVESKTGTAGGYSSIGIYGWTHSPCVEWYINEDAFGALYERGTAMATIDGATYSLYTTTTTGTGGANACESGHTGGWTQMISTRKTARQCGTVTVSDHFAAWTQQGWKLGTLSSVHINVEVGGGTGTIQFPVANVTTASN